MEYLLFLLHQWLNPPDYVIELIEKNEFMENTELFMECYWENEKTATVRLDNRYAYIKRYISPRNSI